MCSSSSSRAAAAEWGIVSVFTFPAKRSGSIPSAAEATCLAVSKRQKTHRIWQHTAEWINKERRKALGYLFYTSDRDSHCRTGFLCHRRQGSLTPVVFNSRFLALNFPSFALHFATPKPIQLNRNQCLADDCPSWWTAVHIWKISTNVFRRFLCSLLLES